MSVCVICFYKIKPILNENNICDSCFYFKIYCLKNKKKRVPKPKNSQKKKSKSYKDIAFNPKNIYSKVR